MLLGAASFCVAGAATPGAFYVAGAALGAPHVRFFFCVAGAALGAPS